LGLLVVAMELTACSSVWKNSNDLGKELVPPNQSVAPKASGHAWVALRFPVSIDANAAELLKKNWDTKLDVDEIYKKHADGSIYYAAELYKKLIKYFPAEDVLLEPQYLTVKSGKPQLAPLAESKVPVFFAVNFSDSVDVNHQHVHARYYSSNPQPLFNITTSGLASPKTCGAVASDLINHAVPHLRFPVFNEQACLSLSARQGLQPIFWEEHVMPSVPTTSVPVREQLPFTPNQVLEYPRLIEELDDEHLKAAAKPTFKADEKNSPNRSLELLAAAVRQGISQYDLDKALRVERLRYVADYDPELAKRIATLKNLNPEDLANGMSPEDRNRLQQIDSLAEAEKHWISETLDKRLADAVINGPFGKSFRATRFAMQEAEDAETRQRIIGRVLGVVGAAAAGAAAGAASSTALNAVQMAALQATSQVGVGMALSSAMSNPASAQDTFYSQFGAELAERNQGLEVKINNDLIKVKAKDRESLHKELIQKYREANTVQ
jgi:hypothetical protein